MKFSTRGLKVALSVASATPATVSLSAVTNAKPALVTASDPADLANGDLVKITGTGLVSLDDKFFEVANLGGYPGGAAITSVVAGGTTTSATITVGGGPSAASGTVTLAVTGPTGAIVDLNPVSIIAGDTADQVAAKIAAELNGKQDATDTDTLVAIAAGAVVTVTELGGGTFSAVTATVAGTTASAGQFELKCSDASGEAAAATAGTAAVYKMGPTGPELVPFCIDTISRDVPAGETISVATFCDPQAQVSGEPTAGTLSWGGPIDFCDLGFQEMQKALEDGVERLFVVKFPQDIGFMIVPIEINSYSESFGLNAAGTWTGGAVVKTKPTYRVCGSCAL